LLDSWLADPVVGWSLARVAHSLAQVGSVVDLHPEAIAFARAAEWLPLIPWGCPKESGVGKAEGCCLGKQNFGVGKEAMLRT
jgi:hypothetical protein